MVKAELGIHLHDNHIFSSLSSSMSKKGEEGMVVRRSFFLFFVLLLNHYDHPKNEGNARNSQLLQSTTKSVHSAQFAYEDISYKKFQSCFRLFGPPDDGS